MIPNIGISSCFEKEELKTQALQSLWRAHDQAEWFAAGTWRWREQCGASGT